MADESNRIKAIFMAALEKTPPAERATYLEEACAGDAALRQRVESLFEAHDKADRLLDQLAIQHFEEEAEAAGVKCSDIPMMNFLGPPQKPGALGRLGHYEVMEVVGKGAMGIVMRAFDEKLHRIVAIKVLAPELARDDSARLRFVREARAAAAVTHENVIDIHAVENDGPIPYLIMQFVEGCTLQQKLERTGPLQVSDVLRLGIQIADGLAAAHRHGLVHRDVKPANILLENGVERVKITDFGLARAVNDATVTQSGLVAGTPAYMSPEQARGEKLDSRSDLFSLGSVLYTLCAGHPPFQAGNSLVVMRCICDDTPRPIRELNPAIPEWLEAIIARLHSKDAGSRFATAREVATLLSRGLTQVQAGSSPSATLKELIPLRPSWRSRWVAAVVAALAIVAAGIMVWDFTRNKGRGTNAPSETASPPVEPAQPQPWQPRPPLTPEELAKLPDPLDDWRPEEIPVGTVSQVRGEGKETLPELIALLGDGPFRMIRKDATHWPTQSPDGRRLAIANGNAVIIYDTETGAVVRVLTGHTDRAFRGNFSSDGKRYACGSHKGGIRVWDVETGKVVEIASEFPHSSWTAHFAPGDKQVVLAGDNGAIKVWDVAAGRNLKVFGEHKGGIPHFTFNPDKTRIASGGKDGAVKIWSWPNGTLVKTLEGHPDEVLSVAYSANGSLLACGSTSRVLIRNAETFEVLHTLETAGDGLLGFTPNGQTLLTGPHHFPKDQKRAFARWDVKTGKALASFDIPGPRSLLVGHLSGDGGTVYLMTCYDTVEPRLGAYDALTGKERVPNLSRASLVWSVAFSPDGHWLASAGDDGRVCLWDLSHHPPGEFASPARVLIGHQGNVLAVAFSPDSQLVASAGADEMVRLWRVADGQLVHELTGHSFHRALLAFSPDGETLAGGSLEGGVNVWNVKTGQRKDSIRWHVGPVRALAFSPDGRWLATGGFYPDKTVQLVDRTNGQRVQFAGEAPVIDLAFSPDSQTLAAAGPRFRLWDIVTRKEQIRPGHKRDVLSVAFHPAGDRVATASADGTVRLWATAPGADTSQVLDFSHVGASATVAFSPSGRHLAVGLDNGNIAILRVR
jgi:eukaryotic-like serine/threonine-protein kinase